MSTLASVNIYDLFTNRPAFGIPGRMFWASDTGNAYYDTGSAWVSIATGGSPLTTKGDLFGFSSVAARVPVGSDGQVLTADSTQTLGVKWDAPGSGGDFVKLEAHTASSSAHLDFTSWYSSSYDVYQMELEDILPATNNTILELQVSSDGGSTWATSNFTFGLYINGTSADQALQGSNGGTIGYVSVGTSDGSISNSSAGGVSGKIKIYNPGSATKRIVFLTEIGMLHSNGYYYHVIGVGEYNASTAINALRLVFNSGNIASGSARIYGLSN